MFQPVNSRGVNPMEKTIDETTVDRLGDVRVGVANIGRGEYTLPDGTTKKGLAASLFYTTDQEHQKSVGEGSIVEISGTSWKITKVKKPWLGGRGSVTLESI
jgi:hypothetical protein